MKKLMIAAAIVCAAALSQAASIDWKVAASTSKKIYSDLLTTKVWTKVTSTDHTPYYGGDGAAYFILASNAETIEGLLKEGKSFTSYTLDSASSFNAYGGFGTAQTVTDDAVTLASQAYKVLLTYTDSAGTVHYQFSASESSTGTADPINNPVEIDFSAADHFATGNWKTVSAVPEPTSAMLLLLGVAGMALRRRRA